MKSALPGPDERTPWLEQLLQDLRYAVRQLVKAPGFAAIAILTIALGIGACTSLFSVVHRMILHPLDYEDPDGLLVVHQTWLPKYPQLPATPGDYQAWKRESTVFASLDSSSWGPFDLAENERFTSLYAQKVTQGYFASYHLVPELGRTFLPEEMAPGKDQVAILSHGLWMDKFGGRKDVIGEKIRTDNQTYTVIGVIWDPQYTGRYVYLPNPDADVAANFADHRQWVSGRLKPNVTLAQAQMEMDVIAARLAQQHPESNKDHGVHIIREEELWSTNLRVQLYALLGAVGFLLLIACVNVASLLLARANARQKEIAVRAALGAGRGRIVRQFLSESLVLAMAGGLLGILFAYASMGPLISLAKHFMPHAERIAVNGTVLATMCGVMLLAGLGFGLVPALQATRGDMIESLKDGSHNASGGRTRLRTRNLLVMVEIAFALMLLVGTGLMIRSLHAMQTFDQGLKTENVASNQFTLNFHTKYTSPEKILNFTHEALERIHALPDIESASFTIDVPMGNRNGVRQRPFLLEGGQIPTSLNEAGLITDFYAVTPEYFHVLSIPLIQGRGFDAHDIKGAAPVVLINQEMVRKHFANQNPIGHRIRLYWNAKDQEPWREIVGVVGDVKPRGPESLTGPQAYIPFDQAPEAMMTLLVRRKGPSPTVANSVRDIIHSLDKDIPFETLYDYDATISYSWIRQRFNMILFTLFSVLALVLAAIGIYGVMAYSVTQRTHEIGIRMALGALPGDVLRLIMSSGARVVGIGLLLGAGGALATTRLLRALLFNTSPYDPVTFIGLSLLLAGVGLLACWIPARRATKVNPLVALRHE